ncbi:nuclear transport factor 2 family protein, partial [Halobacillus sp. BBL2006]|uniref:nuclear transport factor 2 family protein n=1 Tax=Halobacillus sp. BBL2006 TaxID=1543706 RepID=UPI00054307C5
MEKNQAEKLQIVCIEDCGNAPKKTFLKEFNIAFAKGDVDFITESVSEDFSWEIIGEKVIHGKDEFTDWLDQLGDHKVTKIHIQNILTHGRMGAVNGTLKMKDGRRISFCDMYTFTDAGKQAKIKE